MTLKKPVKKGLAVEPINHYQYKNSYVQYQQFLHGTMQNIVRRKNNC